ncbi:helix-turn-helix domain-containing protein [Solibacillus sp. A46]|uniref:Helix-turn-helix domain-containing protein n=1 Tax=Solibacillus faecavium TaxID=2762221 RepID=A0ABR8XYY3_9BACL|nr:DnaD domain protein [Solibacillus faecavium]MBD8037118.1 helix-turn-helix domain-containing protein [Solibacillus faecavium]
MAEQYNRRFEGIWIPANIWLSETLTMQEKIFLVEIKSLDNEQGCFASNEHFGKLFQLSKSRCSEVINKLKEKGLITIQQIYKENSKQVERRIIRVNYAHETFNEGVRKTEDPIRKVEGGIRDVEAPPSEKAKDNNTGLNNTSNNTNKDKDRQSSVLSDPNFLEIKQLYESNVRVATFRDCQAIDEAMEIYEPALILEAIKAGASSARSFKYILGILDNWRLEFNVKTYADWQQKIESKGGKSNGGIPRQQGSTRVDAEERLRQQTERLKGFLQSDGDSTTNGS